MTVASRPRPIGRRSHARRPRVVVAGCRGALAATLRRAARHVLASERRTAGELEIVVVRDAAMARLHRRWKDRAGPTDTLSFDLRDAPTDPRVCGVVVVCADVARRVARRRGTPLAAELALYVVHGCLHLLGYDDARPADFRRMHRREDALLSELGFGSVFAAAAPRAGAP
ncbi:MAG: rRNA maturation RNase YbeY [Phycisphaerae bacterium]